MFKLSRPRSGRSGGGDRFLFHFSDFQVVQVPKGWDKLLVALVSTQTGKTMAKLGKATVLRDDNCLWAETLTESISIPQDAKESEEPLWKFVVSTGLTKSGVLGEAGINLARYITSKASVPLSLPLSKCDHGTVLQLNIQCQTPRTKSRKGDREDSNINYHTEDEDAETKSDFSDNTSRGVGSSSINHMEHTSDNGDEPSFSQSGSQHSFDSDVGSSGNDGHPPQNISRGTANSQIRSEDSSGLENSTPTHSLSSTDGGSPKGSKKAPQATIKELQAECRMWEGNARKATLDVAEQSKKGEALEMELSASQKECSSLKQEILQLKLSLDESRMKKRDIDYQRLHIEDADKRQEEFGDEIRSLKNSNTDLAEQLQKTQDSNAELLSILRELEGIVETQKAEIIQLSNEKLELEEYSHKIEMEWRLKDQALLDSESKWGTMLAEKEEEIRKLKEQTSQSKSFNQGGTEQDSFFPGEVEFLKTQLVELERECSELVEENIQLAQKLKEAENNSAEQGDPNDLNRNPSSTSELESQITGFRKEIKRLKKNHKAILREKQDLETKSSDLEGGKQLLELELSKLEEENIQLSGRISNLEAQQRQIFDEKEVYRVELQRSDRQVTNLRGELARLEKEIMTQKVDMKEQLEDMRKHWLEAQEECEYLKKANPRLELTVGNLMEECNSLQKLNADLKSRSKELQERQSVLEIQAKDSEKMFSECSSSIEALEEEFSAMMEVMVFKEESIKSQLEFLVEENKDLREQLAEEDKLLNQMYTEKALEVENLKEELVHFVDQISSLYGEDAKFSSEAIIELSSIRAEKSKLEISLEELRGKLASSESELKTLQLESEAKVTELTNQLNSSRQKHEVVLADQEKLSDKLRKHKRGEKKLKSANRDLGRKLKALEHTKARLEKETSILKAQQKKVSQLQDEVVALKNTLDETKFEREKLHASFSFLSGEHKRLAAEKASLAQKIGSAEMALAELEEYRYCKTALEEKISRIESDLIEKEALSAHDADLKIELGRVKRANHEMQRKIKYLEQDREQYMKKVKASSGGNSKAAMDDYLSKIQSLENELAKALEANDMYQSQLTRFLSDEQSNSKSSGKPNGSDARDDETLVWNLQAELKDIRERYFEMSLKYAEVEAQREELVMKLKSKNNKKGWFS